MNELIEPILAEIKRRKLSEAAVSRAAVGNPSALKNLRVRRGSGSRNHPLENLVAIAESLGLQVRVDKREAIGGFSEDSTDATYEISPALSAHTDAQGLSFSRGWFERHGLNSASSEAFDIRGNWMTPQFPSNLTVMIDRGKVDPDPISLSFPRPPAPVYVCDYGGERMLARVERQDGSHFLLSFDNPEYPPCYVRVLDVMIIGRVVWWAHTVNEEYC